MGLHVSHGCWNASYSQFMWFRVNIAKYIGIELLSMEGYTDNGVQGIPWDSLPPNALHTLLHHSDCDGSIRYADARKLADALESLLVTNTLEVFAPADHTRESVGYWRNEIENWIRGCRQAARERKVVRFG